VFSGSADAGDIDFDRQNDSGWSLEYFFALLVGGGTHKQRSPISTS
jgi:hypothetical protein